LLFNPNWWFHCGHEPLEEGNLSGSLSAAEQGRAHSLSSRERRVHTEPTLAHRLAQYALFAHWETENGLNKVEFAFQRTCEATNDADFGRQTAILAFVDPIFAF